MCMCTCMWGLRLERERERRAHGLKRKFKNISIFYPWDHITTTRLPTNHLTCVCALCMALQGHTLCTYRADMPIPHRDACCLAGCCAVLSCATATATTISELTASATSILCFAHSSNRLEPSLILLQNLPFPVGQLFHDRLININKTSRINAAQMQ